MGMYGTVGPVSDSPVHRQGEARSEASPNRSARVGERGRGRARPYAGASVRQCAARRSTAWLPCTRQPCNPAPPERSISAPWAARPPAGRRRGGRWEDFAAFLPLTGALAGGGRGAGSTLKASEERDLAMAVSFRPTHGTQDPDQSPPRPGQGRSSIAGCVEAARIPTRLQEARMLLSASALSMTVNLATLNICPEADI